MRGPGFLRDRGNVRLLVNRIPVTAVPAPWRHRRPQTHLPRRPPGKMLAQRRESRFKLGPANENPLSIAHAASRSLADR